MVSECGVQRSGITEKLSFIFQRWSTESTGISIFIAFVSGIYFFTGYLTLTNTRQRAAAGKKYEKDRAYRIFISL
jgi:hypothetical protein